MQKMKKLLGIVVLGLLISGNVYGKELILVCENFKNISYDKKNEIKEDEENIQFNELFKINTIEEKVYKFDKSYNKFYEQNNTKWNDVLISWRKDNENRTNINEINRLDLSYKNTIRYYKNPELNKIEHYAKCEIGEQKL